MPATAAPSPAREALRHAIVERAGVILAEEGLAAVQARRLAEDAGCSVGTLYNLFADRDGLILAVNRQTLDAMSLPLEAARATHCDRPLEERLQSLARAYLDFALTNLNRWLTVFEFRLSDGRNLPGDYVAARASLLGLLERTIAQDVTNDRERRTAARALFGAVHGILHLAVNNRLSDFDADTLADDIRFIVRAAARGILLHRAS